MNLKENEKVEVENSDFTYNVVFDGQNPSRIHVVINDQDYYFPVLICDSDTSEKIKRAYVISNRKFRLKVKRKINEKKGSGIFRNKLAFMLSFLPSIF